MERRLRTKLRRGARFGVAVTAALVGVVAPGNLSSVEARTTTTKYDYNADGALTAFTTEVEGTSETTYVTWDNFVPSVTDPTTGSVVVGDGTLVAVGDAPGLPAQFEFDARHRLTRYTDGNLVENVDYHANGDLQSTEAGGDTRRFYFDRSENAEIMNIHQSGQDLWSGMLDHVRYLSDGTEQVLLQPRKDMAAQYDAAGKSLDPYHYDAYGAQDNVPLQSTYDLRDNPMQYATEYRDPMWGGYYLRARWYHPDLPVFLSRDPTTNLNRYGYAGGNAVMRADPSGMGFFKGLREANTFLNKGALGHFDRIMFSPLMVVLQVMAYPKQFWNGIEHNKAGIDYFLAAGVVIEVLSMGVERYGASMAIRTLSHRFRFGMRLLMDSGLGIGQAVAAGADKGFHHFNWETFTQNAELSLGTLHWTHLEGGVGFHPFGLKSTDVLDRIQKADDNSVLIFRERTQGNSFKPFTHTSPMMEVLGIGRYHERIIAVSRDFSVSTELGLPREGYGWVKASERTGAGQVANFFRQERAARYQFVGKVSRDTFSTASFKALNPRGLLSGADFQLREIDKEWSSSPQTAKYKRWTNNCHSHAYGVLQLLEFE